MQNRQLFEQSAIQISNEVGVPADLLLGMMEAESNFNPNALSPKGATGLMQLMPATAKRFGVNNISDPIENIRGGATYLKYLLNLFNGDETLAIAGYNAGEGAVKKFGNRVPHYKETVDYVERVKNNKKKYYIKPPGTDMWNLPVDAKPSADTQVPLRPNGEVEPPKMNIKPFSPSAMSTSGNMELEAMLQRTTGFLDKDLASHNGNMWSKNYHDQYWSKLAQDTGLTGIEMKERAASLLLGLAQSMGGNLLEPQFWYERGLMSQYVDNMPQIFAIKRQELQSGAKKENSAIEQLKIDAITKSPGDFDLTIYPGVSDQEIFDVFVDTAKAYGEVGSRELLINPEFLKQYGLGHLAFDPKNRMKLQEAQKYIYDNKKKRYEGNALPDVSGIPTTGTFAVSAGGQQTAISGVPKDVFEIALEQAVMSTASDQQASQILGVIYSNPLIDKSKHPQEFIKTAVLDVVKKIGSEPVDDATYGKQIDRIKAIIDPSFWSKLGISPFYYENSRLEINSVVKSATDAMEKSYVEKVKANGIDALMSAITSGDKEAFNLVSATLDRLNVSYKEDLGDQFVTTRALTENALPEDYLKQPEWFKQTVDALSKFNIKSPIVTRFLETKMPSSTIQDADGIIKGLTDLKNYVEMIPGNKQLFINSRTKTVFDLYDDLRDGAISKPALAQFYREFYDDNASITKMAEKLTQTAPLKELERPFNDFVNEFFHNVTFGISGVSEGRQPGRITGGKINLNRRDLEQVWEKWNDAYIVYSSVGHPNPTEGANKAVKESLGVFYNDFDDLLFKDSPSVVPYEYSYGDNKAILEHSIETVRKSLDERKIAYTDIKVVWDFSKSGVVYDIFYTRDEGTIHNAVNELADWELWSSPGLQEKYKERFNVGELKKDAGLMEEIKRKTRIELQKEVHGPMGIQTLSGKKIK